MKPQFLALIPLIWIGGSASEKICGFHLCVQLSRTERLVKLATYQESMVTHQALSINTPHRIVPTQGIDPFAFQRPVADAHNASAGNRSNRPEKTSDYRLTFRGTDSESQ
jgi:hypothetical protein